MNNMDNLTINTLRFLAAEAIQKAKSGHPGLPLGAAPAAYTLWAKELKANPLFLSESYHHRTAYWSLTVRP